MSGAVLVAAPTGRDADLICRLLRQAEMPCVRGCLADLLKLEWEECAAIVVADEALMGVLLTRFEDRLDGQPDWSELPVVLIQGRQRRPDLAGLRTRRSTAPLQRPLHMATLLTVIRGAAASRRRQHQVRDLLQRLNAVNRELEERATELQRLAITLNEAEMRERERVGTLLHDDLQQMLVAADMSLEFVTRDSHDSWMQAQAGRAHSLLQQAIQSCQSLSHELSQPALRHLDLDRGLAWLAENVQAELRLPVEVRCSGRMEKVPEACRRFLFRAVREILFNIVKHARARKACVGATVNSGRVRLTVADDGQGFGRGTLRKVRNGGGGIGLLTLQQRVAHMAGVMTIHSRSGRGTRIELDLPLVAADPLLASTPAD